MKVTKITTILLAFAFFIYSGTANAQLTVNATGETNLGTSGYTSAKLRIHNTEDTYNISASNYNSTNSSKYGIYTYTSGTGTGSRYGIYNSNYGNSGSSSIVRGIYNYTSNPGSGTTYGVYSNISTAGSGTRYGVYSTIGTASGYSGYFIGDVLVDGSFTISLMAPAPTQKTAPLTNVTDKIKSLNTIAFANKADQTQYSFDAASLRSAFPELVKETERPAEEVELKEGEEPTTIGRATTITTVDYSSLVPVLVEAIKEQQQQIEMLERKVKQMEQ